MGLAQQDIDFIKDHLEDWLAEKSLGKPIDLYRLELQERIIRVEEELKSQQTLMRQGFEMMKERFEQVDKRFESMQAQMDKRFEQVDKRFEQMDKRFESIQAQMDKRFESVHQDIRELQRRMDRFMVWSFATTVTVGGLVITALKLMPNGGA